MAQVRPASPPTSAVPLSFAQAPAFFAAVCLALGILYARQAWVSPPLLLFGLLMAVACTLAAMRLAPRVLLPPLALVWLLLGALCGELQPGPSAQSSLVAVANAMPHFTPGRPEPAADVRGTIVRLGPVRRARSLAPFSEQEREEQSRAVDLRVTAVNGQPIDGGMRLTLYAPVEESLPPLGCGDAVRVAATVHVPERYRDPGAWNARAWMLEQGIAAVASARASRLQRSSVAAPGLLDRATLDCRIHLLQMAASERLLGLADNRSRLPGWLRLSGDDAAMLSAMLTGDRSWLARRERIGFERTGSFHLLVVSGMHLAIFAGLVFWMANRLRLPRWPATLLTIALAFAYAVFTGFGQPVQRSFWMVALYLVGRLLWRERAALNVIGFAALCLLAASPRTLFEAGFQMTLLSVLAVAGLAAPLAARSFEPYLHGARSLGLTALDPSLPPRVAQFRVSLRLLGEHLRPLVGARLAFSAPAALARFALRVAELLLVSVCIELVMVLPMALYFHRVTLLSLPVNVLIVPFLGVLLPLALLTFVVLLVWPAAAAAPAAFTAAVLHAVVFIVHTFAALHAGDLRIPGPGPLAIAAWILLLAFALWSVRQSRWIAATGVAALLAAAVLVTLPGRVHHRAGALEVAALDVGQGDALLVISPEGRTLLIDGGGSPFGPPAGVSNFDIGEDVVSPALWSFGIHRLDAVAITHAHADHIGGLPAVLANFHPRELWIGINPHAGAYDALMAEAAGLGVEVRRHVAGDSFTFGGAEVQVLAPEAAYRPGPAPGNNDSLVMRMSWGKTSALLEGDAEAPSEQRMVAAGGLHSDLLKVGHHGSRTSTTPDFLAAVSPTVAVISVGDRNFYGHPRGEVLQELQDAHVHSWRTDRMGASLFVLDGEGVTARPLD